MDSVCRDDCSVCSPRTLVETTDWKRSIPFG